MTVILWVDEEETHRKLAKYYHKAVRGVFQADITDDDKVLMLHFDYNESVNIEIKDLIIAYCEKHGIIRSKKEE